jgi:hypothetical protein
MVALVIIDCMLVRFADGDEVWVSVADYNSNPAAGSYAVTDSRRTK